MSLPDGAEYWWAVKGHYQKERASHKDIEAHNKKEKYNKSIKRAFKKRYPNLSYTFISKLAKANGGYESIKGKKLENLIQP